MKKIIPIIISFLLLVSFASAIEHYYELNVSYSYGEISIESMQVKPLTGEIDNFVGGYVAEILSYDDELLNLTFFSIPRTILYDTIDPDTGQITGGGMIELNETSTILQLPYFDNAKELNIYDQDLNLKLTEDLSTYSRPTPTPTVTATPIPKPEVRDTTTRNIIISVVIILAVIIILVLLSRKKKK